MDALANRAAIEDSAYKPARAVHARRHDEGPRSVSGGLRW